MNNLLQTILELIRRLLGGAGDDSDNLPPKTVEATCGLPETIEIEPPVSHADVPLIAASVQAAASSDDPDVSGCVVTVRPALGTVNLRLGPGLGFEPPAAKTQGGVAFTLTGASESDEDGFRWYSVQNGDIQGWIRADLVTLSEACAGFSFISAGEVTTTPTQPPPGERFPLPTAAGITQGYHSNHRGYDMGSRTGTPLTAPTDGLCIRRLDCTKCTDAKPNTMPNGFFQCPDAWKDPAWGYGYGNFIIMRHDYNRLPDSMRAEMDRRNLTNGFAYILYAHMARIDVNLGGWVSGGTSLGATGNTGCSTGPHLHFEVRIGKDETVDGVWSQQTPVNPKLMFLTR